MQIFLHMFVSVNQIISDLFVKRENYNYMKPVVFTLVWLFASLFCFGQGSFDIRFQLNNIDCVNNTVCYDVQLKAPSTASAFNLAGQNYRIYYDNSKMDFTTGASVLGSSYDPFQLTEDRGPDDASGASSTLGFESTLGFINYSIDLTNTTTGGVDINTTWVTTSNLCFSVEREVFENAECLEMVWANDGMTNQLATAFVEISEWTGTNMSQSITPNSHDHLESSDGSASCIEAFCPVTKPQADIQFVRQSLDCTTSTACYNIQLKATGDPYNLAGQNYRIYYDNSEMDFVSGRSLLDSNYGDFEIPTGGDSGPDDASSTGSSLGFESTLGRINFNIDLRNTTTGGIAVANTWISTAEVCFDIDLNLYLSQSDCLDMVWARDGVSNNIATAYVEISNWVSAGLTEELDINSYKDMNATDNTSEACLYQSCSISTSLYSTNTSVIESTSTATVDICTTQSLNVPIQGQYSTSGGVTAISGFDYTEISNQIFTIPAGQMCTSVAISIINDTFNEETESFTVNFTQATGYQFDSVSSTVTILDDDERCEVTTPSVGPK